MSATISLTDLGGHPLVIPISSIESVSAPTGNYAGGNAVVHFHSGRGQAVRETVDQVQKKIDALR
jgi:uncharacterized protein YlzI (FlbEa/FlbD family)